MQIDRLIQIVFLLLSHENITAKQLAGELGVSTRTIYRDVNILSIAGIPILSRKGYRGGLSLLQGFSLDKSYFTQEEQKNIVQALQILKSSNYPDAEKALNKVAGLFSHNLQSEWLEIDFSYWGSPEKERNNITALERAVINKYVITFTYYNSELTVTEQTAEPLKLVFKSHAWYLIAYSRRRKEIRTSFLHLLPFGEYVEIIEPVEARNILKEKARKILALYQNSEHGFRYKTPHTAEPT